MRALGYYEGYRGFLTAYADSSVYGPHLVDIGAGTASFAEAWVTLNGAPARLTLLDTSQPMLDCGRAALQRRGIEPTLVHAPLGGINLEPADTALAAHVLEHCPDPLAALGQIRDLLRPGGRLYLVVSKPHWCNAIIWLQWRHRTFGRAEILSLVKSAGLTVEGEYGFPAGPPSRTSRGIFARRLE